MNAQPAVAEQATKTNTPDPMDVIPELIPAPEMSHADRMWSGFARIRHKDWTKRKSKPLGICPMRSCSGALVPDEAHEWPTSTSRQARRAELRSRDAQQGFEYTTVVCEKCRCHFRQHISKG